MSKKALKGFTLIELLTVVAIIGILAVLALPFYNIYTARAQVSEALVFGNTIKADVSTSFFGQGWTSVGSFPGSTNINGNYVDHAAVTSDGIITITMGNNAQEAIQGKTIRLVPTVNSQGVAEAVIEWSCDNRDANGIPETYLPSACR